jgi:competence protein ComEA
MQAELCYLFNSPNKRKLEMKQWNLSNSQLSNSQLLITKAAIAKVSKSLLLAASLLIFNPSYAEPPSSTININDATLEQLESINGIGTKKAQAIIDYRMKNGEFLSVEDLTKVKGIGSKFIVNNRTTLSTGGEE